MLLIFIIVWRRRYLWPIFIISSCAIQDFRQSNLNQKAKRVQLINKEDQQNCRQLNPQFKIRGNSYRLNKDNKIRVVSAYEFAYNEIKNQVYMAGGNAFIIDKIEDGVFFDRKTIFFYASSFLCENK